MPPAVTSNAKICYAALKARDRRFDGRFFVGVSSTGIYCRPICRVRLPKEENCAFYPSAAAAEAAGFRPCLKGRPEEAPGHSPMAAARRLAGQAARALEEDLAEDSLAELAARLNVTDRHLRRVFKAEYGVSPIQYVQTRRLLLAKHLLTDSDISITEAALSAGFGSLRRFHAAFKAYRLTPRDFRKSTGSAKGRGGSPEGVTLYLGYRPPYRWPELLAFLAGRGVDGVESVAGGRYLRTVALDGRQGWLAAADAPEKNALAVTVAPALLPALPKVLARARRLFDLDARPDEISAKLESMNELAPGLHLPGLRLPGSFDPFEMSVRAILGQQITVKAARTLAGRLAAVFGAAVETPFPELTRTFPGPEIFSGLKPVEDALGPLGVTGARSRSIQALARALLEGRVSFSLASDPEAEMARLSELPGFGPWTVQYLAMRALAWPDAFPHTDYGVKKALTEGAGVLNANILKLAEAWRPWRSYAAISLWNSLGG